MKSHPVLLGREHGHADPGQQLWVSPGSDRLLSLGFAPILPAVHHGAEGQETFWSVALCPFFPSLLCVGSPILSSLAQLGFSWLNRHLLCSVSFLHQLPPCLQPYSVSFPAAPTVFSVPTPILLNLPEPLPAGFLL